MSGHRFKQIKTQKHRVRLFLHIATAILLSMAVGNHATAAIAFRSSTTATSSSGTGSSGLVSYVGAGSFDQYCYNSGGYSYSNLPNGVWPYLPQPVQTGDLLMCQIESRDNVVPTANSSFATGWSQLYSISNGSNSQATLFYKVATSSSEPDPFFNHSGNGIVSQCMTFRGVSTTTPFDVNYASANSSADKNVESGSLTTSTANDMMVFVQYMADDHKSTAVSQQGNLNWSNAYFFPASSGSQGGEAIAVAYANKASAGSIGPIVSDVETSSTSNSAVSTGVLLALRPSAATSYLQINRPGGTTSGDVMIASLAVRPYNVTLTPPAGWTLIRSMQQTAKNTNKLAVYQKVAGGSEPSSYGWNFSGTHSGLVGAISSFSGVDTTNPIMVENGALTASSTSHTAPSITTTAANAMLVGSFAYASSTNWNPPSGMSEALNIASGSISSAGGEALEVSYQSQASVGSSGAKTATASNTGYPDAGATHLLALTPYIPPVLNHIRLEHDGAGTTCAREPITIKACADASCNALYTGQVSMNLSPSQSSPNGWWNALTGGTQQNSATFTGGSTVRYLANSSSGTVTLQASSINSSSGGSPGYKCFIGTSQSCSLSFATSGFNFSAIPTQTAGTTSSSLTVQAVTGSSGGSCTGFNSGQTVGLAMQCLDPITCGNSQVSINGTAIASNPASGVSNWTSMNLTFDSASSASFTVNYPDVGYIRLYARYPANSGATAQGSSNGFVVRPYGLTLTNIKRTADGFANPAATNATGSVFNKAGKPFSVTVTAVNSSGNATPNFGKEISGEGVTLSHNLVAPVGGAKGTLDGTLNIAGSAFTSGAYTVTDLTWDDVGIITLKADIDDGDYMSTGNVTKTSGNIGRFTPDHFTTNATPACPSTTETDPIHFTYSGQAFGDVTVNAMDASDDVVMNFDNTLGYDKSVTVSDAGATSEMTNNALSSEFSQGVGASTQLTFTFANKATAPKQLTLRATDTDAISSATSTEAKPWIYSGRIYAANATGSELVTLAVPVTAQYYNGSTWVTNTEDNCSVLNTADIALTNYTQNLAAGETTVAIGNNPFASGNAALTLSAPGAGNAGTLTLGVSAQGYLQFDWGGTGTITNPSATIVFGSSTPAGITVIDTRENF